jgi:hypothetical protein
MALFPQCSFEVLVAGGVLMPGTRVSGTLVVTAAEAIPRAEHVDLEFISIAEAGYGSGKNRSVERRIMFRSPFRVDLPGAALAAGEHRFPFSLDLPAWLPPAYQGPDCSIVHVIETRVDVDWAIDPKTRVYPAIALAPRQGTRAPLTTRSPGGFHESIVLEVTLASSVLAHDEALTGHIALRSGHAARFDAVELRLAGSARIVMGRGDRRLGAAATIRIPADVLRSGEAVPFRMPETRDQILPSFRSSFIDHDVLLGVSVDIPWATDPRFDLMLDVLPPGSTLEGTAGENVVGGERLRRIASVMAQNSGLREGHPPTLVEGNVAGPVAVRITDAPRGAHLGIDVDIAFPDVELGIDFRPLGLLEGLRGSPLLPPPVAIGYLLRCGKDDGRPAVDDAVLSAFVDVVLGDVAQHESLRFSDHHLGIHVPIPNDELPRMIEIARAAHAKATAIVDAIARLPFPEALAAARPAWLATAAEQSAFVVPSGPSIHGLVFRTRVIDGDSRTIRVAIRTKWTKKGPTTHVDLDLKDAPLPQVAWAELESETPSERMRAVRALFPSAHVMAQGNGATLERPEWTPDPRALFSAIETFFMWVLEARGERRQEMPYR